MKILILRTGADKLNSATYNLQEVGLAKALVRKGHVCDVAYSCKKENDHIEKIDIGNGMSINIIWLKSFDFLGEGIFKNLEKYIDDYDVIQIGGYVGFNSVKLNRKYPNKVVNYQGPYYSKENRKDNLKAFVYDRLLLPFSHRKKMKVATKSRLATEYILSKGIKNVVTIGVGLDEDKLDNNFEFEGEKPEDLQFVEEISEKKNGKNYLLYIGKIEERRNILFILEVLKELVESNPNICLVMIGNGEDKYVKKVDDRIKELKLEQHIYRKERISQNIIGKVYDICDLFLLPTRYEIFGMVMLEAMYYGVPVVTTYNGGSSTVINPQNGVVIKQFSVEKWKKEILNLFEDEKKYAKMSSEATRVIKDNYTWEVLSDKFITLYEERIGNGRNE